MAVLVELLEVTDTQLPENPDGEFWIELVRAGAKLGDAEWARLSKPAKTWMNDGVFCLKKRPGYEIVPLESPKPDDPPELDPVVVQKEAAAEEPTDIEPPPPPPPAPKRGRPSKPSGKPSKRRAQSFKRGRCYYFAAHLLRRAGGLDGMRAPELAAEYNKAQPDEKLQVSDRTASVLLYDILATLRVLRDLDQFDHVIVADIPKQEFMKGEAAP